MIGHIIIIIYLADHQKEQLHDNKAYSKLFPTSRAAAAAAMSAPDTQNWTAVNILIWRATLHCIVSVAKRLLLVSFMF